MMRLILNVHLHIPLIQFCFIKFQSTTFSLALAARLDRDLFMKTYWYNFLLSCPRFMSNLFIFISEMRRCGAELTIFVLCLRLPGAPAPAAAGICRFAAETKTVVCSNMTSLGGLSDIRPGGLERLEIHNSQGGFTIFRILWPTLDHFQRQSWELSNPLYTWASKVVEIHCSPMRQQKKQEHETMELDLAAKIHKISTIKAIEPKLIVIPPVGQTQCSFL